MNKTEIVEYLLFACLLAMILGASAETMSYPEYTKGIERVLIEGVK